MDRELTPDECRKLVEGIVRSMKRVAELAGVPFATVERYMDRPESLTADELMRMRAAIVTYDAEVEVLHRELDALEELPPPTGSATVH